MGKMRCPLKAPRGRRGSDSEVEDEDHIQAPGERQGLKEEQCRADTTINQLLPDRDAASAY